MNKLIEIINVAPYQRWVVRVGGLPVCWPSGAERAWSTKEAATAWVIRNL